MQIFVLDENPIKAAQYLCDRHVVKITLETAQILSTVVGMDGMYRPTHANHPCTRWARESLDNRAWLKTHGLAIGREYTRRYGKIHGSVRIIEMVPEEGRWENHTPFAQAIPLQYQQLNAVEAYRAYYLGEKKDFATWKLPSLIPDWFTERTHAKT
jgi:hypothetical protein